MEKDTNHQPATSRTSQTKSDGRGNGCSTTINDGSSSSRSSSSSSSSSSLRARSRWRILRAAVLGQRAVLEEEKGGAVIINGGKTSAKMALSNALNEVSIHAFGGFKLLEKHPVLMNMNMNMNADRRSTKKCLRAREEDIIEENSAVVSLCECSTCMGTTNTYDERKFKIMEYSIPIEAQSDKTKARGDDDEHSSSPSDPQKEEQQTGGGGPVNLKRKNTILRVRTRERIGNYVQVGTKVDLKALTSHRYHGVDNTGNTRVWDSESVLTYCIMRRRPRRNHHHEQFSSSCSSFAAATGTATATATASCSPKAADSLFPSEDSPPKIRSSNFSFDVNLDNILSLAVVRERDGALNYDDEDESTDPTSTTTTTTNNSSCPSSEIKELRVLELGCGMAGIAGLALAALDIAGLSRGLRMDVLLTDGHPDAVYNNDVCSSLTSDLYLEDYRMQKKNPHKNTTTTTTKKKKNVRSHRLLWNASTDGARECENLTECGRRPFRLCLVSDCLHFVQFHDALLATIGRSLDVGGICLLCQPHRGTSVMRFIELIEAVNNNNSGGGGTLSSSSSSQHYSSSSSSALSKPLFEFVLIRDYDDKVTKMHHSFLANVATSDSYYYQPSNHYPLLLILKKVRPYEESVDTSNASKYLDKTLSQKL